VVHLLRRLNLAIDYSLDQQYSYLARVSISLTKVQHEALVEILRKKIGKDFPLLFLDCAHFRLIQIRGEEQKELAGPSWIKPPPPKGIFLEVSKIGIHKDDEMCIECTQAVPKIVLLNLKAWSGCGVRWQQLPSISL